MSLNKMLRDFYILVDTHVIHKNNLKKGIDIHNQCVYNKGTAMINTHGMCRK